MGRSWSFPSSLFEPHSASEYNEVRVDRRLRDRALEGISAASRAPLPLIENPVRKIHCKLLCDIRKKKNETKMILLLFIQTPYRFDNVEVKYASKEGCEVMCLGSSGDRVSLKKYLCCTSYEVVGFDVPVGTGTEAAYIITTARDSARARMN